MADRSGGALRGHRSVPHTADVIVEAWGPDRAACLEEVVRGAVETFADVRERGGTHPVPLGLEPDDDEEQVVALIEEVLYLVDVLGVVPADVTLQVGPDGSLSGSFDTVPVSALEVVGAEPKGASRSDLVCEHVGDRWRCRVLLDV